jgi:hypothetical protein
VHEVSGATRVHADPRARVPASHLPGATGVIEVNVCHDERGKIVDTQSIEDIGEMAECRRWPHLDQHPFRRVEEVAGEALRFTLHPRVDRVQPVSDLGSTCIEHAATLEVDLSHLIDTVGDVPAFPGKAISWT